MNNPVTAPTPIATTVSAPVPTRVQRLLSLDVVRGITIAFMIMVNNNGGPGSWRFMNHASWNGLTPTDLVFPTFVFVVGVSVVFAFDARLARGATRARLAWHTVQRAVVLFLLGIVVNSFPFFQLQHMRFYGVLQRIAVCYLVVGLFYLWDNRASTKVVALVVALVGYWILVRWVPIPGVGTPGRDVPFMDMTQNLVSWIDRLVFPHHLYLYAPDHNVRDPEGLLSDLPAIGTALLGVLTGLWLRSDKPASFKANGLAVVALSSLALGYFWALWFPLNKNMWTSSFVLVAAGYSLAVLAFAFWAIEVRGWRKGWTWVWLVFGSNAIAAYMFSELLPGVLDNVTVPDGPGRHAALNVVLFAHIFAHIPNPHWAAFAYSVSFTAVCFIPVWILYRKKIFLKV
ncbi:MAG TPA: heparan-alpha-glucosaminide N-acetyltransferase domain-containing protein [Terracidiphilus sp.]|jgi:predicted acyltransferase|nr:heparan-alpha-glucosaminide N-acetyltransferase domain-containing protein [Terracidiphilus sp.]